jgi:hypothetical protein
MAMDKPLLGDRKESWEIDVTGNRGEHIPFRIAECHFGKYIVQVQLDEYDRFKGILEIKINRDFIERGQNHIHDVDKFYIDEDSKKK